MNLPSRQSRRFRKGAAKLQILGVLLSAYAAGCGYRFAGGTAKALPPSIETIAVAPFENDTLQFKIEQHLTSAVVHELVTRTPYQVHASDNGGDATLRGVVTGMYSSPVAFDPESGRTTEVLLTVILRVRLQSSAGEPLFEADDWVFREPYEISQDPATYFGENQPAMERLSRRVAASLVSALLEGVP
jgi:hypothetical protein